MVALAILRITLVLIVVACVFLDDQVIIGICSTGLLLRPNSQTS